MEHSYNKVPDEWNRLTEQVIGAAMEVHTTLGPGLLEKLYESALAVELRLRGIPFQRQVPIRMRYKNEEIGDQCMDMVVGTVLVLELKATEKVADVHLATLLSYLRSSGFPLGLLINFNVSRLKDGLYRRVYSKNTPTPIAFSDPDPSPDLSATTAFKRFPEHKTTPSISSNPASSPRTSATSALKNLPGDEP